MAETLALSLLIIAIAVALLCVKMIFRKNGTFSSQHIHDNPGLRKQGIHCVIDQDKEARRTVSTAVNEHGSNSTSNV
ncbi:hypothetical protein [Prevotella sp. oral taxon 317]|jgi:hypothetical protein|uniref:hypothetical protein n=1 Tax=Prevotella sp. oral taxon 317 TaxID=652721 RepID=UPI0005C4404B|nr:hypothetical protein [Prevotella sp. oral taxon 317]